MYWKRKDRLWIKTLTQLLFFFLILAVTCQEKTSPSVTARPHNFSFTFFSLCAFLPPAEDFYRSKRHGYRHTHFRLYIKKTIMFLHFFVKSFLYKKISSWLLPLMKAGPLCGTERGVAAPISNRIFHPCHHHLHSHGDFVAMPSKAGTGDKVLLEGRTVHALFPTQAGEGLISPFLTLTPSYPNLNLNETLTPTILYIHKLSPKGNNKNQNKRAN